MKTDCARYVEVVSLRAEPSRIIVPKLEERLLMDAPEPGFYRDEETGKLYRCRWNRRRTRKEPPVQPYRRIDE